MLGNSKCSDILSSKKGICPQFFPKSLQKPYGDGENQEKNVSKNYINTLKLLDRLRSYKNFDCFKSNNEPIESKISKGKISYPKRRDDLIERMEKDSYRRHFSKISIDLHKNKSEMNSAKISKKSIQSFIQSQMQKEFTRNQKIQSSKTEKMMHARKKEFEILDKTIKSHIK